MNIQLKRENLKRDVHQVLSKRPDGLLLTDLWSEVSRDVGYEIKAKDYRVPRLSYFLYLWGGEFRVTENKIFCRDTTTDCQTEQTETTVSANKPTAMDLLKRVGPSTITNYQTGRPQQHEDGRKGFNPSPYSITGAAEGGGYNIATGHQAGYMSQDINNPQQTVPNKWPYSQAYTEAALTSTSDQTVKGTETNSQMVNVMDLMKKTGSNPKPTGPEPCKGGHYLTDEELANFKTFIINKLECFQHGIKEIKLIPKLDVMKDVLNKVINHWGSFVDFVADQMNDVVDINKSKLVCLRQFLKKEEEVIDLTNDSVTDSVCDNTGNGNPFQYYPMANIPHSHQQVQQHQQFGAFPDVNQQQHSQNYWDSSSLNVQPITKKDFEKKEVIVIPLNVPNGRVQPSLEFVNKVAQECIEMLAGSNEFVMAERVEKLLFQKFQIHHLRQIGVFHVTNIPCIFELNRLLNRIHGYVISFVKTRPICTLYELKDALVHFIGNIDDFSQLKVGPLQRSPVVFQHFKFPPDQEEIPQITSLDVLEHFGNYKEQLERLSGSSKAELDPFMNYLVELYKAENGYYLGVRIISLPLAAGILRKAQYDAMKSKKYVYEYFKEQIRQEMEEGFRKFRATMLRSTDGETMELRRHYLNLRADDVIIEVFEKFNHLITHVKMRESKKGNVMRMCRVIDEYIYLIREVPMCKSLFHMSLCMSDLEVRAEVLAMVNPDKECANEQTTTQTTPSGHTPPPPVHTPPPPRKDKLMELVKVYIERCLTAGSLSLTHLDRIEEKLLEEFGFEDFHRMGYGRFLQFVVTENKQTLEEGGGLILGSSSAGSHESMAKPGLHEIQELIKQCRACGITKPEEVEGLLCKHYEVTELRYLGHGNINRLLGHADKHKLGTYSDLTVFYQSAFTKPGSFQGQKLKVGVLGHQTRDLAKICLHSCPLLEDMATWSQWHLVFEPELGKLKDFIQKYGGLSNKHLEGGKLATLDFLGLETKPGVLLKLVSTTSPEHVAAALERRDVDSFCGHLVSMVVAYKGVNNLPKALLVGHIKTALLQLHAADPHSETPGAPPHITSNNMASKFVLQCLVRIPSKICVDLADDLFLSPLGQVVGSAMFKQVLVQLCGSVLEVSRLAELGCMLGIQEWTDSISEKCVLSELSIHSVTPEEEEDIFEEDQDEQIDDKADDSDADDDDDMEDLDDILDDTNRPQITLKAITNGGQKHKVMADELDVVVLDENTEDQQNDEGNFTMETNNEEVKVRTCEDIINEIRKEEFGVGVHLSEDGERLMKVQQERLGRSLDRLSKDLYSKDTHFVFELVQNADDNSYHDNLLDNTADVCPSVKFVIDKDKVCVSNNEVGFLEKNIRALCDVGRSTKGKHKFGYIGQKGIGFKSVFRVSDVPEIHSNGYHIQFDVNSGPMGYILPHWSPPQSPDIDDSWETNIILTLRPDMKQQARTLAARFNDLHPSLLLFLHRLRKITIDNKVENSVQTMKRQDIADNIVQIQHSRGLDRWLVIKKTLDASNISSQMKSGADVESTEIALAFPLKHPGQKLTTHGLPPKQLVFAFLPLRSYGFRFIVQGDFDVPSSREDVDRDSSWNQWLRNEIHTLFLDSLDMFKSHKEFNDVEAVISFLQFVPMEDEILDFFKPVAADILKKLKARPCVPTQPNEKGVVSWRIPSQTVRVQDPLVRQVITADMLEKHLNLHYLHPDVATLLNPTLTSCLGIETLASDHLYHLGKTLITDMGGHCDSPDQLSLVSQWLACMYSSLDEFHHDDTVHVSLMALPMLPLTGGRLVSLEGNTVFIPTGSDGNSSEQELPRPLLEDMNSLHPMLMKTNDDEVNGKVHKLLTRLGVKQLSPFEVINHHIIPVLKSELWKEKSETTLVSYLTYIKDQTDRHNNVCNIEELKDIIQIVTNQGVKNPTEIPVHFSPQYGGSTNLQETFPGYDWTVIDPVYLPTPCTKLVTLRWHDFFVKLGVEDFFSIQKRDIRLKKEDLAASVWRGESESWPQGGAEYIIQDYHSEEVESLITKNAYPSGEMYQAQMRALCLCLEKLWDNQFSRYKSTHVCDSSGAILKETSTSFSIMLQTSCWLPAALCKCMVGPDGSVAQSRTIEMMEPANLYIPSNDLEKLVSNKVPLLSVNLVLNSSFHQFLNLRKTVSTDTLKDFLLEWCCRSESSVPAVFCTSLSHMRQVYTYLSNHLNRKDLQNILVNHPVFFVPSNVSARDSIVAGKMLKREELWLSDKTGLFDKHKGLLEEFHSEICKKRTINSYYGDVPELINVFRQEGRIDAQPQVAEYLELLSLLCTSSTPKDGAVLADVLYIYTILGQLLSSPSDSLDDETAEVALQSLKTMVKKRMQKEKVLPTKKGVWVSLNENPLISDNKELEKMFINKPEVHFLDMREKHKETTGNRKQSTAVSNKTDNRIQQNMIEVLIGVCGVPQLSECVNTEVSPPHTEACPELQRVFHETVPTMQKYLVSRFPDVYKELAQRNTQQMLASVKFCQTKELKVKSSLNMLNVYVLRDEKCVISPPSVYIHENHVQSMPEINREIARYFSAGNNGCSSALRIFLSELNNIQSGLMRDTVAGLLWRHEAGDISIPDNEIWEVAEPVVIAPEPEPFEDPPVVYTDEIQPRNMDGPGVRKAWPPTSFVDSDRSRADQRVFSKPAASNLWPPPQAKEYMRSVKDLPSNVRMAGPDEVRQEVVDSTHDADNQGQSDRKRKLSDVEGPEDQANKKVHGAYTTSSTDENTSGTTPHQQLANTSVEGSTEGYNDVNPAVPQNPKLVAGSTNIPGQQTVSDRKTSYIKGDPAWTKEASEFTLDQLASGPELPSMFALTDKAGDPEIGRWGENLVAGYLQQQKVAGNIIDYVWNNNENEMGAPYDFVVKYSDGSDTKEDFIEVKSTASNDKEMFEISVQQIKFAEEKKDNFHIYRVFNAGNPENVRLARIFDLNLRLSQKQVKLCLII